MMGEGKLVGVGCRTSPGLFRGRRLPRTAPRRIGEERVDIFVEIEANRR
jgi:hypothetical protein